MNHPALFGISNAFCMQLSFGRTTTIVQNPRLSPSTTTPGSIIRQDLVHHNGFDWETIFHYSIVMNHPALFGISNAFLHATLLLTKRPRLFKILDCRRRRRPPAASPRSRQPLYSARDICSSVLFESFPMEFRVILIAYVWTILLFNFRRPLLVWCW